MNTLIEDVEKTQEDPKAKFHYSLLLILLSIVMWFDPPDYQPMDVLVLYLGTKYQNLWEESGQDLLDGQ